MQRFRGGLVFKAHRLCVSLNSRLESSKEEKVGGCLHDARRHPEDLRREGLGVRVEDLRLRLWGFLVSSLGV